VLTFFIQRFLGGNVFTSMDHHESPFQTISQPVQPLLHNDCDMLFQRCAIPKVH